MHLSIINYVAYSYLSRTYQSYLCSFPTVQEPMSFHDACQYLEWIESMHYEISAFKENQTWKLIPLPSGKHTIWYKWVYKVKLK